MAINTNANGGVSSTIIFDGRTVANPAYGTFHYIKVNGKNIGNPDWNSCIDNEGIFHWRGVTIKPSGSVRIGSVKIHPSGLIQVADDVHIEGSISQLKVVTGRTANSSNAFGTTSNLPNSQSILSESSNKANIQPKKVAFLENDGAFAANKSASSENQARSVGSKRKSTEAAPESAKKQKTGSAILSTIIAEHRTTSASAPKAPEYIYQIVLEGQYSVNVPVHESCDQVRRKIKAHLAQPGVTKAQFCRDMFAMFFSPSAPKKIQPKMVDDFLKKHGPSHGCTSSVYYAAYVYFEKCRILRDEGKSKHRLEMEKIWPDGMERDRDDTARGFTCGPNEHPRQDSYGRWYFD